MSSIDFRLKDIRRLMATGGKAEFYRDTFRGRICITSPDNHNRIIGRAILPPGVQDSLSRRDLTIADLDRLISLLGANFDGTTPPKKDRPAGESRPKDTDEVSSTSEGPSDSAELHGGDGNSGEVDAPAQTASQDSRESKESNSEQSSEGGDCMQAEQDGSDTEPSDDSVPTGPAGRDGVPSGDGKSEASPSSGEPTSRDDGTSEGPISSQNPEDIQSRAESSESVDNGDRDDPNATGTDAESDAGTHEQGDDESELGGGVTESDDADDIDSQRETDDLSDLGCEVVRVPLSTHGGLCTDHAKAQELSIKLNRPAKDLVRAIKRLVREIDIGGTDESPRIDGRKLVGEIVSRRYAMSRIRREECDLPLIVLMTDCSGSCSVVCTDTLAACQAVAAELPNVVIVEHSNGFVVSRNSGASPYGNQNMISQVLEREFPGRRIGLAIAFGDWDAGEEYRRICESGAKLVWLDSYCCSVGEPKPASSTLRTGAKGWKSQPLGWYQGVSGAAVAAIALRQIAAGEKL